VTDLSQQLMKLLQDEADGCFKETEKASYMGQTIAIDASMQLYQFLVQVRSSQNGGVSQQLTNENGDVTSHILGFFHRTIGLLNKGIKPVFVFDGKPPEMKLGELKKRKAAKQKADEDFQAASEAIKDADDKEAAIEEANRQSKRTTRVTREHNQDIQELLTLMGLPFVLAPSEAEAQCAEMCKKGKVFGVGTEDMDTLTFGAPILLRKLTLPDSQKQKVVEIHYDKMLSLLGMPRAEFVDLCILSGCDYCSPIKGIGGKTALKLIRQHKSIEKVIENLDQTKHPVPDPLINDLDAIRAMFNQPEVTPGEDIEIVFGNVKEEELLKFLVDKNGFDEGRVKGSLKRIEMSKSQTSQRRLDSFFKPKVSENGAVGFNKRKGDGPKRGAGVKRGRGRGR